MYFVFSINKLVGEIYYILKVFLRETLSCDMVNWTTNVKNSNIACGISFEKLNLSASDG